MRDTASFLPYDPRRVERRRHGEGRALGATIAALELDVVVLLDAEEWSSRRYPP
jgi:hypothetical protein